jgi:hypothetical protein
MVVTPCARLEFGSDHSASTMNRSLNKARDLAVRLLLATVLPPACLSFPVEVPPLARAIRLQGRNPPTLPSSVYTVPVAKPDIAAQFGPGV